jgi:hypothetical protein
LRQVKLKRFLLKLKRRKRRAVPSVADGQPADSLRRLSLGGKRPSVLSLGGKRPSVLSLGGKRPSVDAQVYLGGKRRSVDSEEEHGDSERSADDAAKSLHGTSVPMHFVPGATLRHWLHGEGFAVLTAKGSQRPYLVSFRTGCSRWCAPTRLRRGRHAGVGPTW